ncbi:RagB/SusD family nutrient uptake outer membrane protein [Niabella aquatica]
MNYSKKYIMKKVMLLALFSTLILQGCKKFLEEKPFDFVSPENVYDSPKGVKQLITGMYGVFFSTSMFRNEAWIYITSCDDDWTNGLDWVMGTYGIGNYTGGWVYNNSGNDPYYAFYRLVRAANTVLEVLPNVEFPPEEAELKAQYEGEALAMRGLAYFYLVQMYGALPMRLYSDDPSNMPRSAIKDVYAQIIADLHKAEEKLMLNSRRPVAIKRGHLTKGAAQLLLAKVYSTMGSGALTNAQVTVATNVNRTATGDIVRTNHTFSKNKVEGYDFDPRIVYDSAIKVTTRLIDSREYELERFGANWNPANFGGKDFVFALETDSSTQVAFTPFNRFFTPPGLKGAGWLTYAKDFYYLHEPDDERRMYGICHEWKSNNLMPNGVWMRQYFPAEDSTEIFQKYGRGNVLTNINSNSIFLMKWYLGNAASPQVLLNSNDAGTLIVSPTQNFPLLRYAEAFLILAEAENELNGPTATAFNALDVLRTYRFRQGHTDIPRSMNQHELRSYILEERSKEFAGEGYRRFDLIRWGIYLQTMAAVDLRKPNANNDNGIISKRREQKHLLHPIPTIEIDGNTDFGANNPGW